MTGSNQTLNAVVPPAALPGRSVGIAGFVLSFLAVLSPLGLVLSIVAIVQARAAGRSNGLAWAGAVIGLIGTVVLLIVAIYAVPQLASAHPCSVGDLIQQTCR